MSLLTFECPVYGCDFTVTTPNVRRSMSERVPTDHLKEMAAHVDTDHPNYAWGNSPAYPVNV